MIDFHSFENVHLEDVAEYGRAKKGHVYPGGLQRYRFRQRVDKLAT